MELRHFEYSSISDTLSSVPIPAAANSSLVKLLTFPGELLKGYIITSVVRGSPGHRSGALCTGDVLLSVNKIPVCGYFCNDNGSVKLHEKSFSGSRSNLAPSGLIPDDNESHQDVASILQTRVQQHGQVLETIQQNVGKRVTLEIFKDDAYGGDSI